MIEETITGPTLRLAKWQPGYAFNVAWGDTIATGWVYAFGLGSTVKIGMAKDWKARKRQIQSANPHEIRCVAREPVTIAGLRYAEAWAHSKMKERNVRQEWFDRRGMTDKDIKDLLRQARARGELIAEAIRAFKLGKDPMRVTVNL